MDNLGTELLVLLRYLLPGFLAAWVFYGFTSYPKPSQFERVIQALVFTLIVQVGVFCVHSLSLLVGRIEILGVWNAQSELIASVALAVILGLTFAYFANTDKFHALARRFHITRETSYSSEWFAAFSKNITNVILHISGERRLYGWPIEWPSDPNTGHFLLKNASWLTDDGELHLDGAESILIPASEVSFVEFMERIEEIDNEQEGIESATTASTAT